MPSKNSIKQCYNLVESDEMDSSRVPLLLPDEAFAHSGIPFNVKVIILFHVKH